MNKKLIVSLKVLVPLIVLGVVIFISWRLNRVKEQFQAERGEVAPSVKMPPKVLAEPFRAVFFKGNYYLGYDAENEKVQKSEALTVTSLCPAWKGPIDAALLWYGGMIYLFKGDEYVKYNARERKVLPGYPKKIQSGWPGLWTDGIDAAVNWDRNRVYFFKGSRYVRFDVKKNRVSSKPSRIKGNWPGVWSSGADAACRWSSDKIYFFRGNEYLIYNMRTDRVPPGYPRRITAAWPGVWESEIDAAVNLIMPAPGRK